MSRIDPNPIPDWPDPGLPEDPSPLRQAGDRKAGLAMLQSFLEHRGRPYRAAMASPLEGETACSRLSPHLAYGILSLREVYTTAVAAKASLDVRPQPVRQDSGRVR